MRNIATGSTWAANGAATVTPNTTYNGGIWTKFQVTAINDGMRLALPLNWLSNGQTYTVAFDVVNTGTVSVILTADWCDASSTTINLSEGQSTRVVFNGTRATYDATFRFLDIATDTIESDVLVKDVLVAIGADEEDTYFDGDTPGYEWDDEPHTSTSSSIELLVPGTHARLEVETTPGIWTNITGPTTSLSITFEDAAAGSIGAEVLDATLDPLVSDQLRRGKAVRVRGTDVRNGDFTVLYTGTIDSLNVKRHPREARKVSINLTATNNVTYLAGQTEARGVASIDELRWLVTGVPFNINGSTTPLGSATVVSKNDNASIWDEVLLTRDTALGHAWIDKNNVLQAWDANLIDTTAQAVIGPDVYQELNADWDATQIINSVTVNFMRYNIGTETSAAVAYGPYTDDASIAQWGAYSQTFTMQGDPATESEVNVAAYANEILARNATAEFRPQTASIAFHTTHDLKMAHRLDLNSRVSVVFEDSTTQMTMRVSGIKYSLSPDGWSAEYAFAKADGVSSASTPPGSGIAYVPPGSIGETELDNATNTRISDAAAAAADALAAANDAANFAQAKIAAFWQTTQPTGGNEGDIWFDTDDGNKMYRRSGGVWVVALPSHLQTPNGRLTIDTNGLTGYDSLGNLKVSIDAGTGAFFTSGPVISGGDVTGATVTGGTVQTTATANRGIKLNSSYLIAYDNAGNATLSIDASTGAVAMKGSLTTGSSIVGASITASTLTSAGTGRTVVIEDGYVKLNGNTLYGGTGYIYANQLLKVNGGIEITGGLDVTSGATFNGVSMASLSVTYGVTAAGITTTTLGGSGGGQVSMSTGINLNNYNINSVGTMTVGTITGAPTINNPTISQSSTGSTANVNWNGGAIRAITSSRRYKTNIEDLVVDLNSVYQLVPRKYIRIEDNSEEIGFIAEEALEAGLNDWVMFNDAGQVESFDYYKYVVALQAAVVSLNERLTALEAA